MATVELTRQTNNLDVLYQRYQKADQQLAAGSLTKILHLLPEDQQGPTRAAIRAAQQDFWQVWTPFRGGLEHDSQPNFYHVVGRLPVLSQFRDFIDPQSGDLIVDLAGGSAAMAAYFDSNQFGIAGYVNIDSNPLVQDKAKHHLLRLGHSAGHVIHHDLADGLPESLGRIIAQVDPFRVRYISNWGISYLDVKSMTGLIKACLDPDVNHGIPSTLDFNMLTNGRFDPKVLAVRFMLEVMPQHLLKGQLVPLLRAFRAMPTIIRFGKALPGVAPIWYPEEIRTILADRGLTVTAEAPLLWGQSTAIKVQRSDD